MPLKRIGIEKQYLIRRLEAKRRALLGLGTAPGKDENPTEGKLIDTYGTPIGKETIEDMVKAYGRHRLTLIEKNIKQSSFSKQGLKDTKSCWFDKEIILELLSQPDCVGLRIYYGIQTELDGQKGYHNVILVGLRENKEKLRSESEETLRRNIEGDGSAADYYKDMLSDAEDNRVVYPVARGFVKGPSGQQEDNAYDFGGLGPPLQGPLSSLDM